MILISTRCHLLKMRLFPSQMVAGMLLALFMYIKLVGFLISIVLYLSILLLFSLICIAVYASGYLMCIFDEKLSEETLAKLQNFEFAVRSDFNILCPILTIW